MNLIVLNKKKILENVLKIHKSSLYKNNNLPEVIAVSKQQCNEKIIQALDSGHRIFGENKVQEAYERWRDHIKNYKNIELHLIGPLQTNKVKKALKLFDVIHTIDRESLALEIYKNMNPQNRTKKFFIQVNTGSEKQKSGVLPRDVNVFFDFCLKKLNIPISGLMCIPPINETPSEHFCFLNKLAKKLNLKILSMGMSSDYQEAIKFGATHLRIGTSFFGKRINNNQ